MFARLLVWVGVGGLGLLAIGAVISFVGYAHDKSDRRRSENNLRQIGFALFHSTEPGTVPSPANQDFFPAGTVPNPALTLSQRLSFYAYIVHSLDRDEEALKARLDSPLHSLWSKIDKDQPWDQAGNREVASKRIPVLLCPGAQAFSSKDGFALTNYLGNAGLVDGGEAPRAENSRGIFDVNKPTPFADIKDGLDQTISFVETDYRIGPWLQGGEDATLRTWRRGLTSYFGPEAGTGGIFNEGFYVGLASGRAIFITNNVDPRIFLSLLTIDGTEPIE